MYKTQCTRMCIEGYPVLFLCSDLLRRGTGDLHHTKDTFFEKMITGESLSIYFWHCLNALWYGGVFLYCTRTRCFENFKKMSAKLSYNWKVTWTLLLKVFKDVSTEMIQNQLQDYSTVTNCLCYISNLKMISLKLSFIKSFSRPCHVILIWEDVKTLTGVLLSSSKHPFSLLSLLFCGANEPHSVPVFPEHIHTSLAWLWL